MAGNQGQQAMVRQNQSGKLEMSIEPIIVQGICPKVSRSWICEC